MQYAKALLMKDRRSGERRRREVGTELSVKGDAVRKPSSENLRPQIPGWSVWRVVSSHVPDGINCWGKTLEERQSLRDTKWSAWVISYYCFVSLALHLSISKTCTHVETHTIPSGSTQSVCYREIYAGILYGEIASLLRSSVNNFHSHKVALLLSRGQSMSWWLHTRLFLQNWMVWVCFILIPDYKFHSDNNNSEQQKCGLFEQKT